MADITITAASVLPVTGTGATISSVKTAGETITAGQSLYQLSTDNKMYKGDANGTAEAKVFAGIALNGAAINQTVVVATSGDLDIGATGLVGDLLIMSATPGGIAPVADLASGMVLSIIGFFKTTTRITMITNNTGALKA